MLMLSLVRTPDRHRTVTSGNPDLKPFQAPAPQAAVTVGHQPNQPQERCKFVTYKPRAYIITTYENFLYSRAPHSPLYLIERVQLSPELFQILVASPYPLYINEYI